MKPFDLQKALDGEPVVTRDGRKVLKLIDGRHESAKTEWVFFALIDGVEMWRLHDKRGRYSQYEETDKDLFMADPVMFEGWVNVYRQPLGNGYWIQSKMFASEKEAKGFAGDHHHLTIKITFPIKP